MEEAGSASVKYCIMIILYWCYFENISVFPQRWIDGGLTNGLPILPVGRTVTISPFSGRLDICPQDKGRVDLYVKLAKQDMMVSCLFVNLKH